LIGANGRVLAYLQLRDRKRVLVLYRDEVTELAGWPKDAQLRGWARHGDWVYGLVADGTGTAVWRSDGATVEQVAPSRDGWRPRALAAGPEGLWAVTAEGEGGAVWRSVDGRAWKLFRAIQGGRPHDVAVHDGWLFVGGAGDDGAGALWGERLGPVEASALTSAAPMVDQPPHADQAEPNPRAERLAQALGEAESYRDYGEVLRDLAFDLAQVGPAPDAWAPLLETSWPSASQPHFSDGSAITAEMLGRRILLWGMSVAGTGRVPLDWLAEPWATPANPAEKYYVTAPAAIWTVGQIGQADAPTISALVARLERRDDPLWLTGDVVGALAALTGERFAYDRGAWRDWWATARTGWPDISKPSQ
ncbi:MAG: hypothetical protein R3285_11560, partial [Kiloniellales bacterium]|nr:hypothetical protein [Kiloniellales bacterium]